MLHIEDTNISTYTTQHTHTQSYAYELLTEFLFYPPKVFPSIWNSKWMNEMKEIKIIYHFICFLVIYYKFPIAYWSITKCTIHGHTHIDRKRNKNLSIDRYVCVSFQNEQHREMETNQNKTQKTLKWGAVRDATRTNQR